MEEKWLKCNVYKGMFSDELVVEYTRDKRDVWSAFVPRSSVRGEIDSPGFVRVRVFRNGDTLWAVTPTEYSDSIVVDESDLVPA